MEVRVYEAGPQVGVNIRDWGHVRVFTPWRYCVDAVAVKMLRREGWMMPREGALPTGNEIVSEYLEPLAAAPALAAVIKTDARVSAISRQGVDKVVSRDREDRPFTLIVETAQGVRRDLAWAVVDASGTWQTPNPLGAGGLLAEGEAAFADRIEYGIPDILGRSRGAYAGLRTLVIGSGHSAANALLDLASLAREVPGTKSIWATRSADLARIYSGELGG
jgi:hypothetical protein